MALVPMFMPVEAWSEMAERFGTSYMAQSTWLQLVTVTLYYIPTVVLEPFYIGAGFGLYLNRRTQLEAWDVELAFRRLRERLGGALLVALLAMGLAISPEREAMAAPANADVQSLHEAMGKAYVDPAQFEKAVEATKKDPLLHPVERRTMWVPRDKPRKKTDPHTSPILNFIAELFAAIVKYALWILVGLLVGVLLLDVPQLVAVVAIDGAATPRRPLADRHRADRSRRSLARRRRRRCARVVDAGPRATRTGAAVSRERRKHGRRTGATLVPGATEAECLRALARTA